MGTSGIPSTVTAGGCIHGIQERKLWSGVWAVVLVQTSFPQINKRDAAGISGIVMRQSWCSSTALSCTNSTSNYKDVRPGTKQSFNPFGFSEVSPKTDTAVVNCSVLQNMFGPNPYWLPQNNKIICVHYWTENWLIIRNTYIPLCSTHIVIITLHPNLWNMSSCDQVVLKSTVCVNYTDYNMGNDQKMSVCGSVRELLVSAFSVVQLYPRVLE